MSKNVHLDGENPGNPGTNSLSKPPPAAPAPASSARKSSQRQNTDVVGDPHNLVSDLVTVPLPGKVQTKE